MRSAALRAFVVSTLVIARPLVALADEDPNLSFVSTSGATSAEANKKLATLTERIKSHLRSSTWIFSGRSKLVTPGSCEYETDSTRIIHINDNLSGSWSTKITSFRPNLPECDIQYPAIESGNLVIRLGRTVSRVPGAGFNASVTKSIKYIKQDASVTEYNFRVFESGKKIKLCLAQSESNSVCRTFTRL